MGWEILRSISGRSIGTLNNSQVLGHPPSLLGNGQLGPLVRELGGRDLKLTNHLLLVLRLITSGTIRLAVM